MTRQPGDDPGELGKLGGLHSSIDVTFGKECGFSGIASQGRKLTVGERAGVSSRPIVLYCRASTPASPHALPCVMRRAPDRCRLCRNCEYRRAGWRACPGLADRSFGNRGAACVGQ